MKDFPDSIENSTEMEVDTAIEDDSKAIRDITFLMNKSLQCGDEWYLIDKEWFDLYKRYLKERRPIDYPGPINNSRLLCLESSSGNCKLSPNLEDSIDYLLVPSEAWIFLKDIFGLQDDRYEIKRKVVRIGNTNAKYCFVEVYPFELKLCLYGTKEEAINRTFSRTTTLRQLENEMRTLFNVGPDEQCQLWGNNNILNGEDNDNCTLCDVGINNNVVTLEVQNPDGSWPSSRPRFGTIATRSSNTIPGLCGLMNLGNTCFMNSALQCMSNTPLLTEYFLSDKYLYELNTKNPLGMHGEIAKTFADLIKAMWSGNHTCLSPLQFKMAVGRFAPQFSGFAQQDAQELMAFLLDGLHEDLNRVKQKPYFASKDETERRPDEIVAAESWSNYKKRNDSIIVDTFHGLLKSTLVCPECRLVSVTFDPYCYLSLPLPVKRERLIDVTYVPLKSITVDNKVIKFITIKKLAIPKYGFTKEIAHAVSKVVNESKELNGHCVDPSKLVVTVITNHRFSVVYKSEDIHSVDFGSIWVFEKGEGSIVHQVYLREVKSECNPVLFGKPFIVTCSDNTYEGLYKVIKDYIRDHFCASIDELEFTLSLVNSFGSLTIAKLNEDVLAFQEYIGVDFPERFAKEVADEHEILKPIVGGGKTTIHLSDCIDQFTTTERLGEDDPWYCPACKKHQQATKKFDIWSLPKVSIIHLKRFSHSRIWRDKLDGLVQFPIENLELGQFMVNNPEGEKILYDLIAVANHYGGLGGGHYTAYAKSKETGLWYDFNDSHVNLTTEDKVVSKAAYVLFYERKNIR